ncbi:MAG: iron ABC transporter permease, partial [Propionicimonas sp.]
MTAAVAPGRAADTGGRGRGVPRPSPWWPRCRSCWPGWPPSTSRRGTAAVDAGDLLGLVLGRGTDADALVVIDSRWPRLTAALAVGAALGAAGSILQGMARNPLASPTRSPSRPAPTWPWCSSRSCRWRCRFPAGWPSPSSVASSPQPSCSASPAARGSPLRLVLAGTVLALALSSLTSSLMILNTQETRGLFAWGAGSPNQRGLDGVLQVLPVIAAGLAVALLLSRNLDLLALGEDVARGLGVRVGANRLALAGAAVLLTAAAVTIAGPIGFVGLCAPALVALAARRVPPLARHAWRIPVSALVGILVVLSADVGLRLAFGPLEGVEVPTGVVTTVFGGVFLAVAAHRLGLGGPAPQEVLRLGAGWTRRHPAALLAAAGVAVVAGVAGALLLGDSPLLLGDVAHWLSDTASKRITLILDARAPRVASALLAGAALAVAGALVQAVTRNPLADPGILGVSSGAGLGAVLALVALPGAAWPVVTGGAAAGAFAAAAALFALSLRGGLHETRVVLVGIGLAAAASAVTSAILVRTDPWNQAKAITWLGGSTYGTGAAQLVPLAAVLVASLLVLRGTSADLDVLQVDDATPRLLGLDPARSRMVALGLAVLLTGAATASIGVLAFVGLVAPHAGRLLVGRRHRWLLPLSALLGGLLVVAADTVGRTVIAPSQLPAGLVTSLVGAPYFLAL